MDFDLKTKIISIKSEASVDLKKMSDQMEFKLELANKKIEEEF
jgi:hypothetical protein